MTPVFSALFLRLVFFSLLVHTEKRTNFLVAFHLSFVFVHPEDKKNGSARIQKHPTQPTENLKG